LVVNQTAKSEREKKEEGVFDRRLKTIFFQKKGNQTGSAKWWVAKG